MGKMCEEKFLSLANNLTTVPGVDGKNPIDPCDIIAGTRHRGKWDHTKFGIEVHFINLYNNIIIIDLSN